MKNTLNEWIEKAKKVHGDKYDYSKSTLVNCKVKTAIICPIHGEFNITWDNHVNGKQGCPKCNKPEKPTTNSWVLQAKKVHGDKYDYSKTEYVNAKTKVCIICHEKDENGIEHGEFYTNPYAFLKGSGCPKCKHNFHYNTQEFVNKAKKVHGDKYDYSKTEYINTKTKVCIICHEKDENGIEHGEFWQLPSVHLEGSGCPKCKKGVVSNTEEFTKKASLIHNNFYNYDSFEYKNAKTKSTIKCPIHGEFLQSPFLHLKGNGCPKCKFSTLEKIVSKYLNDKNIIYEYQFVIKGKKTQKCDFFIPGKNLVIECQGEQHFIPSTFSKHYDKYEFFKKTIENDNIKYQYCISNNIDIVYFTLPNLLKDKDCISKNDFYSDKIIFTNIFSLIEYIISKPSNDSDDNFSRFISSIKKEITQNYILRHDSTLTINDIVIKYQPLCENKKNELNDLRREQLKSGKKSLIIYEDEFADHKDIVISKIKHICNIKTNFTRIPGRKCTIKEITQKEAYDFLSKNHIQGFAKSTIYVGSFYKEQLIGVMTFLKENKCDDNWILSRFATDINYICQGVGGKLFEYFKNNFVFNEIKSFADKRWTINLQNNFYIKMGFNEESNLYPDYYYFDTKSNTKKRYHKFNFRKNILHKKYGLPLTMTETEMTEYIGFKKIWNCGLIKYVYKNKNRIN